MTDVRAEFYTAGGTLRQGAPSYIERQADADLFDGLTAGDFCYALTSRQMGKSSLMVRTAVRLRATGATVVSLDLTGIGQNVSVEQWYLGLLNQIGEGLGIEDELEAFWFERDAYGPLQRWMAAVTDVVLPRVSGPTAPPGPTPTSPPDPLSTEWRGAGGEVGVGGAGRLVIFVDEIDVVRGLPFSTDEFFAGIRELYVRRATDPELERLAFCFLGVAAPSDLIRDTRLTPFNVGRRIELTDFTEAQAERLAEGIVRPNAVMLVNRVLHWTGGHPYLTQRLCAAVAGDASVTDPAGVDRLCDHLFFSDRAKEQDTNLLFVRDSLLRGEADRASLLDLYGQVRRGRPVADDETNPLVSVLRLSGITRSAGGLLKVRNRIYERVFDRVWIAQNMPDAELRRQRAAYRSGIVRTAAISAAVLLVVASLGVSERMHAREEARQRAKSDRLLYDADMGAAEQAWEAWSITRGLQLLEAHRPKTAKDDDLRGFEWRYLWRRFHPTDVPTLTGHTGGVNAVAVSPDGKTLVSTSSDQTVRLWDIHTGHTIAVLQRGEGGVTDAAFSPDGKTLAIGGEHRETDGVVHGEIRLWNMSTRRQITAFSGHTAGVNSLAFTPDGKTLAVTYLGATVRLWDVASRKYVATLPSPHGVPTNAIAISADGKTVAVACGDQTVRLWDLATRRLKASFVGLTGSPASVALSRNGKTLAAGDWTGAVAVWDIPAHRLVRLLTGQTSFSTVRFSPDGRILATGAGDGTIKLRDVATLREIRTLRGHTDAIAAVAFSPDGRSLASGSADRTIKLWDLYRRPETDLLGRHRDTVWRLAFSPDGRTLASSGGAWFKDTPGQVKLWDVASGRQIAELKGLAAAGHGVAFSPDGATLAVASFDKTVRLWDVRTRRLRAVLRGNTNEVWGIAFSPHGGTLASSSPDGTTRLWRVPDPRNDPSGGISESASPLATFHGGGGYNLAFSPDGRFLDPNDQGNSVLLQDAATGRELLALRGHTNTINGKAFSPDGATLAAGSFDGTVMLWNVSHPEDRNRKREPIALDASSGTVSDVAFSPRDNTLAASHFTGAVTLWDLVTHRETVVLKPTGTGVTFCVAFSPDGNTLAAGRADGTVHLWRATPWSEIPK